MDTKRIALILSLIVAFGIGDLFGPHGYIKADAVDVATKALQLKLQTYEAVINELPAIRATLEGIRKDCTDPLTGLP